MVLWRYCTYLLQVQEVNIHWDGASMLLNHEGVLKALTIPWHTFHPHLVVTPTTNLVGVFHAFCGRAWWKFYIFSTLYLCQSHPWTNSIFSFHSNHEPSTSIVIQEQKFNLEVWAYQQKFPRSTSWN